MFTLEETLSHQKNLGELCADRPLSTNEIFVPNAFYGSDHILKRYCGLPQTYALKIVVPHGVVLSETHMWEAERAALVPVVLCYPPYREHAYLEQTRKRIILSAAPFLYVVEMLKDQPAPARRGTIFFPQHSTHHVTAEMDFERLAEALGMFDEEQKPITVCIYWRDFNLGHHIPFQKRGMQIVSAGHMYDPDFLFRFYHLCSMHRYSAGNGLGSQMFYSVKAGCSYYHLDSIQYNLLADRRTLQRDVALPSPSRLSALKSLFCMQQSTVAPDQLRLADYYLGADYLRSPRQLRQQLLRAEMLDRAGFILSGGGATSIVTPTYYRRKAQLWRPRVSRLWKRAARAVRLR